MKKTVYMLVLFLTVCASAQEKEFSFTTEKGMTDYVVTSIENKTAVEIYKKITEWIRVNSNNVLLSKIENETIKFEGKSDSLYSYNSLLGRVYEKTKYQIEISIKDGKYRFDLIGMQYFSPASKSDKGGWKEIDFFNKNLTKQKLEKFYKKDGSLKTTWKDLPDVPKYFNNLNSSLKEFIETNSIKNDIWHEITL
jgi:hypothetical protein